MQLAEQKFSVHTSYERHLKVVTVFCLYITYLYLTRYVSLDSLPISLLGSKGMEKAIFGGQRDLRYPKAANKRVSCHLILISWLSYIPISSTTYTATTPTRHTAAADQRTL